MLICHLRGVSVSQLKELTKNITAEEEKIAQLNESIDPSIGTTLVYFLFTFSGNAGGTEETFSDYSGNEILTHMFRDGNT